MSPIFKPRAVGALVAAALVCFFYLCPAARAQSDDLAALNQQVVRLYQAGQYAEASSVAQQARASPGMCSIRCMRCCCW